MTRRRLSLLLALYPRSWRRRYGDEFAQFLADLETDQPTAKLGRSLNILSNAVPVQIACRPLTTTILIFMLSGTIATLGVYGRIDAAHRTLASGWSSGRNPMIIRTPDKTYTSHSFATRRGSSATPLVRIQATSQYGARVILDCQAGVCQAHP